MSNTTLDVDEFDDCSAYSCAATGEHVMIYLPALTLGGAEIAMMRLTAGMISEGCRITLALHTTRGMAPELAAGLSIADMGVASTVAALPRLARLLRRERPDVLIAGLTHNNIVAAAAVLMSGHPCRLILTEHAPVSALIRMHGGWRYRLLPWVMPLAYGIADAIVAVSGGVADDLMTLLGARGRKLVQVIHNPVLVPDWRARADWPVDDPWFADGAPPVVLSAGRLSAEKNLSLLLDAFALLRGRGTSARLVIMGEGPERESLQAEVLDAGLADCVRLPGQSTHVLAYMRRSAVFVLTSTFEGFGNVLVEAMAVGTPVVSTDCPVGPREILADGRYGELVAPGSAHAIADAIGRALIAPHDMSAAQERAQEFTVEKSVSAYRALFARLGVSSRAQATFPPRHVETERRQS